jgi:hypothetical protein
MRFSSIPPGQKTIDPNTFNANQFNNVHTPNEAIPLLKFATESKRDDYIIAALNMIYRLCQEDTNQVIAAQLGELGIASSIDALFGQKLNDNKICSHLLQVIYSLLIGDKPTNRSDSSSANPTSAQASSTSSTIFPMSKSLLATLGSMTLNTSVDNNRKRLSTSSNLFRIIKAGNQHIQDIGLVTIACKVIKEICNDAGKCYFVQG